MIWKMCIFSYIIKLVYGNCKYFIIYIVFIVVFVWEVYEYGIDVYL